MTTVEDVLLREYSSKINFPIPNGFRHAFAENVLLGEVSNQPYLVAEENMKLQFFSCEIFCWKMEVQSTFSS